MVRSTYSECVTLILVCAVILQSRAHADTKHNQSHASEIAKTVGARKLSDVQRRGLLVLKEVQAEAHALDPASRAFVLWEASHGFARIDETKATILLTKAFQATLFLDSEQIRACPEVEGCGTKSWLQKHILRDLMKQSHSFDETYLSKMEEGARMSLTPDLFQYYLEKRQFDKSLELFAEAATDDKYPYEEASTLISGLPSERAQDRAAVFSRVLGHFAGVGSSSRGDTAAFCEVIVQTWNKLPPALVLRAIDRVLQAAQDADDEESGIRVEMSSKKGDAVFSSQYAAWAFQLLPVIEHLAPATARDLTDKVDDLSSASKEYRQRLKSAIDAPSAELDDAESVNIVARADAAQDTLGQLNNQILREERQIERETAEDPQQALSDAMSLPLTHPLAPGVSPRASTLKDIAIRLARVNPSISKTAMQEISKLSNIPLFTRARLLGDLPQIYLNIGDEEGARDTLNELVKLARQLFDHDSDSADPNQSFKGMWPSTDIWRKCLKAAAKLNPSPAQEIIHDIPDFEIQVFERVTLGNFMIGADDDQISTIDTRKSSFDAIIVP